MGYQSVLPSAEGSFEELDRTGARVGNVYVRRCQEAGVCVRVFVRAYVRASISEPSCV
jgi:hypothetical protein